MIYICSECGSEFRNDAQGEYHIKEVHNGVGHLMQFEKRGEKVVRVVGRTGADVKQRTREGIRGQALLSQVGEASRGIRESIGARVRGKTLEVGILLIGALLVATIFQLIYLATALVLFAFYVILPSEYELVEKARVGSRTTSRSAVEDIIEQFKIGPPRGLDYDQAYQELKDEGLSPQEARRKLREAVRS